MNQRLFWLDEVVPLLIDECLRGGPEGGGGRWCFLLKHCQPVRRHGAPREALLEIFPYHFFLDLLALSLRAQRLGS